MRLAVLNLKGGTGKTTSAVFLAAGLHTDGPAQLGPEVDVHPGQERAGVCVRRLPQDLDLAPVQEAPQGLFRGHAHSIEA